MGEPLGQRNESRTSTQNETERQTQAQNTKTLRVLVLEDDKSQWPVWESVILSLDPRAEIDWNTTEGNAEALVKHAFHTNNPYSVIICDVFLGEQETGIDLWNRYGETAGNFIFASVMTLAQFRELVEPRLTAKLGLPRYIQKPLTGNMCRKAIRSISNNEGGEDEQH